MKHILTYQVYELVNYSKKLTVNSYDELIQLLKDHNIDLNKWGTSVYKTPQHLWKEIQQEECTLYEMGGTIYREVQYIGAKIQYKKDGVNYRLWEDRAIFKDGRIRIRPIEHSMAEKFKSGENTNDVVVRGMKEELGIDINPKQAIYYNKERIEENGDYPGIRSFHTGYLYLIALNDKQFKPEGYVEHQKDKDIYFVWKEMKKKIAGHYPLPIGGDTFLKKYEVFKNI